MKKLKFLSLGGLLGALLFISSCKETETTTVDITGTAIIQGTVLADFEKVNTPFESEPLEDVIVRILWNSEDLAVISDGDNIRKSLTVRTDASGVYSAEVPTIEGGVIFTVEFDEIQREVTYNDGSGSTTQNVTFNSSATNVTVATGETVVVDQDYEDNFKGGSPLEEFGTIAGVVEADLEQVNTKGISEPAQGVTVRVEWTISGNTETVSVATDAAGAYSVQVPTVGVSGSHRVYFETYSAAVTFYNGIENVTETLTFSDASFSVNPETGETTERNYDYENNLEEQLNQFVIVTGVVEANSERINTPDIPELAEGATVTLKWQDSNNFNNIEFVTTTDANGVYSVQVPINEVRFDQVTVTFEEFTTGVNYNDGFRDVTGFSATYNDATFFNMGISLGTELERNYNYNSNFKEALPTFGIIKGNIEARVNAIPGSENDNPVAGLQVRISWTDDEGNTRGIFVTTDVDGNYTTEVPLTDADDFGVKIAEFVIDPYSYNDGAMDITDATATYAEFNTTLFNIGVGEERTFDRSYTGPTIN